MVTRTLQRQDRMGSGTEASHPSRQLGSHPLPIVFFLLVSATSIQSVSLVAQSASRANPAVPYSLPVVLPIAKTSPLEDPAAPYTPLVVSLIKQLEPDRPPTLSELTEASRLLSTQGGTYAHPGGIESDLSQPRQRERGCRYNSPHHAAVLFGWIGDQC